MSNENSAGKESTGNDRDEAQISIETQEVDGEPMVPVSQLEEVIHAVLDERNQNTEKNVGLEEVWVDGQPVGKIIESNRKTAKEAEKMAQEAGSSTDDPKGKTAESGSQNDETTTLERIADEDEENPAGVQIGPSVNRAATIMKNWRNWSKKAPKGRNIRDGLKTLLETATGETLAWRQVYRACKKVEQLTKGKLVFIKKKKHGWMLLQPNRRASSVGNG